MKLSEAVSAFLSSRPDELCHDPLADFVRWVIDETDLDDIQVLDTALIDEFLVARSRTGVDTICLADDLVALSEFKIYLDGRAIPADFMVPTLIRRKHV